MLFGGMTTNAAAAGCTIDAYAWRNSSTSVGGQGVWSCWGFSSTVYAYETIHIYNVNTGALVKPGIGEYDYSVGNGAIRQDFYYANNWSQYRVRVGLSIKNQYGTVVASYVDNAYT